MKISKKTILIIANLDTRGAEFKMVKELIESQGHNALLLDFSMEQEPFFTGDITCEEVANEGGLNIEEVRQFYRTEREKATENQIRGARKIVRRLMEEGKVHGVLGVGGGTASLVATSVMRKLPFGMPKLMASSMAAHPKYVGKYVGTKDITMLNTVVDVVEINPILKTQLINAVGAICGMVALSPGWKAEFEQPVVAITSFGFAERDGWFNGVIDLVSRGIVEQMLDGNCAAGDDRLLAAGESGVPQVVAPSGLDMLSIGGRPELLERYQGRPQAIIDKLRIEVRTSAEELQQAARIIADRLNGSKAPCAVLIPLKGWSSLDREGGPLYDPEADRTFAETLKKHLNSKIPVVEVDLHLNTPEFGKEAVELFHEIYTRKK
jgi:uncharacterized protein (UPF0261 family)